MDTFNVGDKVVKKDGTPFSNGDRAVTILDPNSGPHGYVTLKETGMTRIPSNEIIHAPYTFAKDKGSDGGSSTYYEIPEGATDLQDLIEHKGMSFAVGNIFKACYRLGEKKGTKRDYDLNKIIWFANRLKAQLKAGN